jgi:hypothetical protein
MTDQFNKLKEEDLQILLDAVPLIAILIAGADGDINDEELQWSKKITHIRSYKMKADMKAFYEEVDKNYMGKLQHFIEVLPVSVNDRTKVISEKLIEVNPIMAKLAPEVGSKLYKSYLSFADHVAKASGGVMGFFSVNKEEASLIGLPMIHPISYDHTNEEE